MAKVELKQPIIDEIRALLDGAEKVAQSLESSKGVFFIDYRGLTVSEDTQLRKTLREAGVQYKVFKNTLIKRAAEGTDFSQLDGFLEGPTAIAVSRDDATAAARGLLAERNCSEPAATATAFLHFILGHVMSEQTRTQLVALGVLETFDAEASRADFSHGVELLVRGISCCDPRVTTQ